MGGGREVKGPPAVICQDVSLVHLVTAEKPDFEKAWQKARGEAPVDPRKWVGRAFLVGRSRARRAG